MDAWEVQNNETWIVNSPLTSSLDQLDRPGDQSIDLFVRRMIRKMEHLYHHTITKMDL